MSFMETLPHLGADIARCSGAGCSVRHTCLRRLVLPTDSPRQVFLSVPEDETGPKCSEMLPWSAVDRFTVARTSAGTVHLFGFPTRRESACGTVRISARDRDRPQSPDEVTCIACRKTHLFRRLDALLSVFRSVFASVPKAVDPLAFKAGRDVLLEAGLLEAATFLEYAIHAANKSRPDLGDHRFREYRSDNEVWAAWLSRYGDVDPEPDEVHP